MAHQMDDNKRSKIISNFVFITVPVDGLAPLGARPSTGTVMIKSVSIPSIYGHGQPQQMGYRQHPNLKMDVDGWMALED